MGRPVVRETISDEAYRAGLMSHGLPEVMAKALGTLYLASRAQEFAIVDPTLAKVLGRKPTTVHEVVKRFLDAQGA